MYDVSVTIANVKLEKSDKNCCHIIRVTCINYNRLYMWNNQYTNSANISMKSFTNFLKTNKNSMANNVRHCVIKNEL